MRLLNLIRLAVGFGILLILYVLSLFLFDYIFDNITGTGLVEVDIFHLHERLIKLMTIRSVCASIALFIIFRVPKKGLLVYLSGAVSITVSTILLMSVSHNFFNQMGIRELSLLIGLPFIIFSFLEIILAKLIIDYSTKTYRTKC